ncbi:glycosyltransferase family 8 protein [Aerococcaceae bacterium zg-ZJ1578]|uniref:glycosyltransferase family 8 protein n=1 Tax=Aerococcaceae bacterium zg-252 TaxID=2796928 RepID=UPI001A20CD8C|nr:glycosyltransferase family 8 protein [Aerococcaceae bacterium zg-1578]
MQEKKKYRMNIVMAADFRMHEQVEVTIKSVLKYHRGVQFFLLNKDYSSEWFESLNNQIRDLDSIIHDRKIHSQDYEEFRTYHYVTEATFYRYHIPELVDEDKVLYLDADIVVTGDLTSFYDTDITNFFMAAVADPIVAFTRNRKEFNAGVMLVNNKKWREKMVLKEALKMHNDSSLELSDADQSVLNILFRDEWLEMDDTYNYQIVASYPEIRKGFEIKRGLIIHYTTAAKPFSPRKIGRKHGLKLLLRGDISFLEYLRNVYTVPFADEWYQVQKLTWEGIKNQYGN